MRKNTALTFVLLLAFAASASASSSFYTVVLTNGTSFETREPPVEADWDPSIVMMRTDQGNWIALPSNEVADVVSREEASGFGYRIDTSTVIIGSAPTDLDNVGNDGGAGDEDGDGGGGRSEVAGNQPQFELPDPNPAPSFRLEQFVSIPSDGYMGGDVPADPVDY